MTLPTPPLRRYRADLLTEHFVLTGDIEPFGPLVMYLNDANRANVLLKNVRVAALEAGNVMDTFEAKEMIVGKSEIMVIRLAAAVSTDTVPLLPRKEKLAVFTSRFIVQAYFHCGPDTNVRDLFEATMGYWAPATEARLSPLLHTKRPVFDSAPLLLLNKHHIRFYMPVK